MKRSRFTATVFVKKRRLDKKKGLAPLFLRISHNGEKVEIALNRKINPDDWDQKKQRSMKRSPETMVLNEWIKTTVNRVYTLRNELVQSGSDQIPFQIKEKFLGMGENRKSVLQVFDLYNEKISKRVGIDLAQLTYDRYLLCRKQLSEFFNNVMKRKDIWLSEVNYGLLDDWVQNPDESGHPFRSKADTFLRNFGHKTKSKVLWLTNQLKCTKFANY